MGVIIVAQRRTVISVFQHNTQAVRCLSQYVDDTMVKERETIYGRA